MSVAKEILTDRAARLVPRNQLSQDNLKKMYRLLYDHFDGVTFEHFRSDIAEKNWIILIERSDRLVGFSTLLATKPALTASLIVSCTPATPSCHRRPGTRRHFRALGSNQWQGYAHSIRAVLTSGF